MIEHPRRCPTCGRPVEEIRFGVPFTQLKAHIIDRIKRRGNEGIFASEMGAVNTIKAHVWQINEKLEGAGWRIVGRGGYRLVRQK